MRALMSVKHSVLDLTSFKRCFWKKYYFFFLAPPLRFRSCYYWFFNCSVSSGCGRSGAGVLSSWIVWEKRKGRSIHVVARVDGFWVGGYVRSRVCNRDSLFSLFFSVFSDFFCAPRFPIRWMDGQKRLCRKGLRSDGSSDVSRPTSFLRYHWSVISHSWLFQPLVFSMFSMALSLCFYFYCCCATFYLDNRICCVLCCR